MSVSNPTHAEMCRKIAAGGSTAKHLKAAAEALKKTRVENDAFVDDAIPLLIHAILSYNLAIESCVLQRQQHALATY